MATDEYKAAIVFLFRASSYHDGATSLSMEGVPYGKRNSCSGFDIDGVLTFGTGLFQQSESYEPARFSDLMR
jgi:hypothetical protein